MAHEKLTVDLTVEVPKPNHQQASFGLAMLFGLGAPGREKHVDGGTVPHEVKQVRRRRNRVARRSRRINRGGA